MKKPNVLVLPFPAQGHVNPLMNFSEMLAKRGFNITFVNTDFNHKRVESSMVEQEQDGVMRSAVKLVSIPDGLGPEENRNDFGKLIVAMLCTVPAVLEKLMVDMLSLDGKDGITCIVADLNMGWALEIASKLGIRGVLFWPASAAVFALNYNIPRLLDDQIIDCDGFPREDKTFQLSPSMPKMNAGEIWWASLGDFTAQKIIFHYIVRYVKSLNLAEWWLCNTTDELEPAALSFIPKLLPVGPLLRGYSGIERSMGQFWAEDLSCLDWLDNHPSRSVIYVGFGSLTAFDPIQFHEIAIGLELTNRPFLWVVRADTTCGIENVHPDEFQARCGKIVRWAPQQKVLSHPAIACFISHCGWNSTMEGLCNGVPFLCWPYFADQMFNKTYICDEWKVGLGFDSDKNGLVSRREIKKKVDQLLGDEKLRMRTLKLKEMLMKNKAEGGQSMENFERLVKWLKE